MEDALADEELADLRFAVGEVEVGLDPHAADDLPTAFFDALLDLLVECGIFFGHPLGVLRGGLREGVVGVLVHELESGGKGALDDVDGFALWPEPGGVDVGVAGEVDFGFSEDGVEGGEDLLRFAERFVEGGLVASGKGVGVDCGYGLFYFGEEIFAWGGESGEEVGGGDALDADVVGRWAAVGGAGIWLDGETDAGEGLVVDGLEKFNGYQDFVAGLGGFEEDDRLEVFAEGDAFAVEVDDLGDGSVGVGAELEGDAGAGDVVAVEGLGDFDLAAVPDGFVRCLGFGLDEGPGGVVEGDGFAVGDVADVEAPVACREGVEGFEGVELGDGGRGEVLLLADWSEGLCECKRTQQEGERKAAKTHEGKVSKCVGGSQRPESSRRRFGCSGGAWIRGQ